MDPAPSNLIPPSRLQPGQTIPAESADLSLSQAILAPLDAIFQAQVHSARSFLNFLWQLGYPEQDKSSAAGGAKPENPPPDPQATPSPAPAGAPGTSPAPSDPPVYTTPITFETQRIDKDGVAHPEVRTVRVPTLAMVPVAPLSIETADVRLSFRISHIARHRQSRVTSASDSADATRPRKWFLVADPISVHGTFSPRKPAPEGADGDAAEAQTSSESVIDIQIKLTRVPTPEALQRTLTMLGNSAFVSAKE